MVEKRSLSGITQGEITTPQPHCQEGKSQGRLSQALIFMEWNGWLIVRLHALGRVGDFLYPQLSVFPDNWVLEKSLLFMCQMHDLMCIDTHWVTLPLCGFPGGVFDLNITHRIIENLRTCWVGKDPLGSSSPTPGPVPDTPKITTYAWKGWGLYLLWRLWNFCCFRCGGPVPPSQCQHCEQISKEMGIVLFIWIILVVEVIHLDAKLISILGTKISWERVKGEEFPLCFSHLRP